LAASGDACNALGRALDYVAATHKPLVEAVSQP
jgi:hypothetical protein